MTVLLLGAGLALLILGAEALVRGASRLAAAIGISPLVVGLTVVAFGTSAPEMAVTVAAALGGRSEMALGNAVGSNIFNVLFILGLAAVVTPLAVSRKLVRIDVPLMIAASVLVFVLALDGAIGRLDGAVLAAGILVYTSVLIRQSRREQRVAPAEDGPPTGARRAPRALLVDLGWILGGLGLLVLGSRWLVSAAVAIATRLEISGLVIGLTIVAAGTSLPEVATSVIASVRGERDIAVGNVVGSNLFNLLGVLGLAGLVSRGGVDVPPNALRFDLPVMTAVALACLPIFFTGHRIARWEGLLFLGYYLAYTVALVRRSSGSASATFEAAMLWFVLPLTAITLAISLGRALRARNPP